jgi:hypothetical protein
MRKNMPKKRPALTKQASTNLAMVFGEQICHT